MEKKYTKIDKVKLRKLYRREKQMRKAKMYVRELWRVFSKVD
jgi:hypothetical protein